MHRGRKPHMTVNDRRVSVLALAEPPDPDTRLGRIDHDAAQRAARELLRALGADVDANNQAFGFIEWLVSGRSISISGDHLVVTPAFGRPVTLIPVADALFREDDKVEASIVFAENDAGLMVMAGASRYAERQSRWRVESVRWPVIVSAAIVLTPLVMLIPWTIASLSRRTAREAGRRRTHPVSGG